MGTHAYANSFEQSAFALFTTSEPTGTVIAPPTNGYPISIKGRNYMVDTSFEPYRREAFRHKSLAPQRQSLHFTNSPDDGTVSTEGLWRREARNWMLGSGQTYFDRKDSNDARFGHSKGIDPWTEWKVSLQPDTLQRITNYGAQYAMPFGSGESKSVLSAMRVGSYVYIASSYTTWDPYVTIYNVQFGTAWANSYSSTTMGGGTALGGTTGTISGLTGTFLDMTTDGYNVYIATTTGVWKSTAGSTSASKIWYGGTSAGATSTSSFAALSGMSLSCRLAYVGGRLMGAFNGIDRWDTGLSTGQTGAVLFDLSTPTSPIGGLPNTVAEGLLFVHPNPNWTWIGIAQSSTSIYFAGYSSTDNGASSQVFRTGIDQAAAASATVLPALSYPVVALPLPPGEYATAIKGYMNYIFLGTSKGIRMCQANSSTSTGGAGELTAGPLIPSISEEVSSPVYGITANGRYVYWSWNNFDSQSSGLGRLDLSHFIDALAPAYASDLMISDSTCTIAKLDWDPITNGPLIVVSGGATRDYHDGGGVTTSWSNFYSGIWTLDPSNCVSSGYITSGVISYGIPDNKNAVRIDGNIINVGSTPSSVSFDLQVDDHASAFVGSYEGSPRKFTLTFPQQFGEQYIVTTTLTAGKNYTGGTTTRVSPTLNRWTLKALPGIPSGIMITVPLLLSESIEVNGSTVSVDPYAEYSFLENLRQTQQVVTYVEGTFSADVTVDQLDWLPERRRMVSAGGFNGLIVAYLKTVTG